MDDDSRVDKYLWAIRVFKTRSEATEACKGGKVKIGDVNAKPSRPVKEGDVLKVRKGAVTFTYRVIKPLGNRVGAKMVPDFAEDLTPEEEKAKAKAPVETFFVKRDRGSGRPTKKDRREMEHLWDSIDFD
jgi:ribosome-associated heat shock protein Hsp15